MPDFIHINPLDNVAVALHAIDAGTEFNGIVAKTDIPQGHKMALKSMDEGDQVIKYGFSMEFAVIAFDFRRNFLKSNFRILHYSIFNQNN